MAKKIDEVYPTGTFCYACNEDVDIDHEDFINEDNWHLLYGCCTHNCLEYEYDYDLFKQVFNEKLKKISKNATSDYCWKLWVKIKFMEKNGYRSLIDMHTSYAKDYDNRDRLICKLADFGLDFDVVYNLVWSAPLDAE